MNSEFTLFYQDEFIDIYYHKAEKLIYTIRKGYPSEDKIKHSLNKTLELLQKEHFPKIISDMRAIKGTWTMTNSWIGSVWMPQAIAAGLKYVAYIYPPDVFSQFALQDLLRRNDQYTMQIFNNLEDAKKWLDSM